MPIMNTWAHALARSPRPCQPCLRQNMTSAAALPKDQFILTSLDFYHCLLSSLSILASCPSLLSLPATSCSTPCLLSPAPPSLTRSTPSPVGRPNSLYKEIQRKSGEQEVRSRGQVARRAEVSSNTLE